MNKYYGKYLLMIFILLFIINITCYANNDDKFIEDMSIVAENQKLTLYLNEETTEIAVKKKGINEIWYSNPSERETREQLLRGTAKEVLNSQFIIQNHDPRGRQDRKNNYSDSVVYDQYEILEIDNGIRIEYRLGEEWRDRAYFPQLISKEYFEDMILNEIEDESDRERLLEYFTLIQLTEKDKEPLSVSGLDEKSVFGGNVLEILSGEYLEDKNKINDLEEELNKYQNQLEETTENETREEIKGKIDNLKDEISSIKNSYNEDKIDLIWNLIHTVINNRTDLERIEHVKYEHLKNLQDNLTYIAESIPRYLQDDILEIIKETGYTPEINNQANLNYNLNPHYPNLDVFEIPVEYVLDNESLIARIPVSEINYPKNRIDYRGEYGRQGEHVTYPLMSIEFLPYFGAAHNEAEGYIFVPDGSGALIDLNTEKSRRGAPSFAKQVYGRDNTFQLDEKIELSHQISLPVFGLKNNKKAFLGVIESGDGRARIRADIAGRTSSYNTVSSNFDVRIQGTITLGQDATAFGDYAGPWTRTEGVLDVYSGRTYQDKIQIRYFFLEKEKSDYVGMAKKYREYLQDIKGLKENESISEMPLILELIGAIPKLKNYFGMPRKITEPLTTFKQAQEIISSLVDNDIENINVKYSGWLSGGLGNYSTTEMNIEDRLGGNEDFKEFIDYIQNNNLTLYPDVSFINRYHTSIFDSFKAREYASRQPDGLVSRIHDYDLVTFQRRTDNFRNIVSPGYLEKSIDTFVNDYYQFDMSGLSLSYMGTQLNSGFSTEPENYVGRQQTLDIYKEQLTRLAENSKIMLNNGHAYLFSDLDYILNIPLQSSEQNLIDKSVPFYQIAINGLINYAGKPVNYSYNPEINKLKLLETGAVPYVKWFYRESGVIKNTEYNNLYASNYKQSFSDISNLYHELNSIYKKIGNSKIDNHEKLMKNVYKTSYENGISVIVNYNKSRVKIDQLLIPGESYELINEEEK